MAALTTRISRKITDLAPEAWNNIFPSTPEGYGFFKTIDETGVGDFDFYYISVYCQENLVGAATCFFIDYALETMAGDGLNKVLARIRKILPRFFKVRMIMCGSPIGCGEIGLSGEDRAAVLKAIIRAMEEVACKKKASIVVFKDFPDKYSSYLDSLVQDGFCKFRGFPSMEISLQFKSFDEYLMSLSHATRKDLKRKFKKVGGMSKIDFQVLDNAQEYLDEVYGLYQQTFLRSATHFEVMPKSFFKDISLNMPSQAKYFLWFINAKLVAFDLCLVSRGLLIDEYIGLDYSLAHEYNLYFITFRDIINWCIENGIDKYYTGALDYDPKKRLGSRLVPLYIYGRCMNRFLNAPAKALFSFLTPHNFDRDLRQAKKEVCV